MATHDGAEPTVTFTKSEFKELLARTLKIGITDLLEVTGIGGDPEALERDLKQRSTRELERIAVIAERTEGIAHGGDFFLRKLFHIAFPDAERDAKDEESKEQMRDSIAQAIKTGKMPEKASAA